jgi:hypothetical protein
MIFNMGLIATKNWKNRLAMPTGSSGHSVAALMEPNIAGIDRVLRWECARGVFLHSGLRSGCGDNTTFARSAAHLVFQHMRRRRCNTTVFSVADAPFEKPQHGL